MTPTLAAAQENRGPPILRDTEAEQLLRDYTRPILRAAGLEKQNIQMVIINEGSFNAFVADGRRIFVNYGAIMQSETPNQIIGVLAHETGHLAGGHLAKLREQLANAQTQMIIAMLLGAGAMVAGSRGGAGSGLTQAGAAAIQAPQEMIKRTLLAYVRQHEEAADKAGVKYLTATGQSAKGMYETFQRFTNESMFAARGADPYLQSHPMPFDRVQALADLAQSSPYWDKKDDPALQLRHDMVRAKTSAFMEKPDTVYRRYPSSNNSLPGALCPRHRQLPARRSARRARPDRPVDLGAAVKSVFLRTARTGAAGRRQAARGDRAAAQGGADLQPCAAHRDVTWAGAGRL